MITSTIQIPIYPTKPSEEQIQKNLSALAKASGVTLSGGSDLIINGDTVQEVTLQGANYSYDSATKKASVSIPEAVQEVSIVGGAIQASITGNKLYLLGSNATVQKADAEFSLTPSNVTVNAFEPTTISASRLGDGLIKIYDNTEAFNIDQKSATDFEFLGKLVNGGTVNAGFWLDETADYYGASKNVNVIINPKTPEVLMHFDDAEEPFLNLGTAAITSIQGAENASIESGGKFGNCLNVNDDIYIRTVQAVCGKDFTFYYWLKKASVKTLVMAYLTGFNGECFAISAPQNEQYYRLIYPSADSAQLTAYHDTTVPILDEWTHCATCYDWNEKTVYMFIGGNLVYKQENTTVQRQNLFQIQLSGYIDEMVLLDGVCLWKENFTPPTAPY